MFKDELGGKVIKEIGALRAKTYSYLLDDDSEVKKAKGTKNSIIKRELMFEIYKDCLFNGETILKSKHKFKSDHHKVYTEDVNKIALSSDDIKRLQTFNRVTTNPYRTSAVQVFENEIMVVRDFFIKKYIDCPLYGEIVLKQ